MIVLWRTLRANKPHECDLCDKGIKRGRICYRLESNLDGEWSRAYRCWCCWTDGKYPHLEYHYRPRP